MHVERPFVALDLCQLQPYLLDGMHRLEALRADLRAVHDRATAKQPVRIVQVVEPLLSGSVAACRR